jgi:hypothetical protein
MVGRQAARIRNLEAQRRERLATAALQGILSNGEVLRQSGFTAKEVGLDALAFADALIAALDAKTDEAKDG